MAITKIDAYQTSDGSVFSKEIDAHRHEAEMKLRKEIEEDLIHEDPDSIIEWIKHNAQIIRVMLNLST